MSGQMQLLLRDQKKEVSIDVIKAQPTFKDALRLCKSISGLEDKQICGSLDIDPGQWARIFGNGGHFPDNKLIEFMELCQNKVPLQWLAINCGYALVPLIDEKDRQIQELLARIEEKDKEIEVLAKYKKAGVI